MACRGENKTDCFIRVDHGNKTFTYLIHCGSKFRKWGSLLARLESAYSLIWGSYEIWGKGGGDTLALL